MGILRNTIILGAAILAMPSPPASETKDGVVAESTSSFAYVSAAAETFADVRAFCERRPGVCKTAGHIAGTMEAKAKYGAKLIYEWANEAGSEDTNSTALPLDLAASDPIATGTAPVQDLGPLSQSTLKLEDLIPEWKAPPQTGASAKKG